MIELNQSESEKLIDMFEDFLKNPSTIIYQLNNELMIFFQYNIKNKIEFHIITILFNYSNTQIQINISYNLIQKLIRIIDQNEFLSYISYCLTIYFDDDMLRHGQITNGFIVIFIDDSSNPTIAIVIDELGQVKTLPNT
jgi:hypothetical protein